ncbi:MAG: phytoene/squalene synthase family protein [Caulobacteraceae bacterium]|nr:MAG: phytoene/squalene synthase family protein [Caulobacteraceae bacterium]
MQDLDARLADKDPDRWLSSRFVADATARADLVALYSLDNELAAVGRKVRDPLVGEMRLAWWREALEGLIATGATRGHAVLEGLKAARFPMDTVAGLPDRYIDALEPAGTDEVLLARIDETDGVVMALAALRLHPDARVEQVADAARALHLAKAGQADRAAVTAVLARGQGALASLPTDAFPAVAHAALAKTYAGGGRPGPIGKRLRITWAVMTGKL